VANARLPIRGAPTSEGYRPVTSVLDRFDGLQMVVVTGKGGVGKSVVTAALGRLFSERGRHTLLVELDPRENLHHLLDTEPSGGEIVRVTRRLHIHHLEGRHVLDDLVTEKLRVGALVRRVLQSPVHQHFAEGAPGLKETAVFGRVLRLLQGHTPRGVPTPDVVVVDAPATGHGISMLAAPQLVADVIGSGPVGHMAAEIAAFLADRERASSVVVTLAEEMPVQEALELIEELDERFGRHPEAVVVNALYPPVDDRQEDSSFDQDPAFDLWRRRRAVNDRELEHLREDWAGPLAELPLLPIDRGPALVGAIAAHLEQDLRRRR